jgi:hypothetical protein
MRISENMSVRNESNKLRFNVESDDKYFSSDFFQVILQNDYLNRSNIYASRMKKNINKPMLIVMITGVAK